MTTIVDEIRAAWDNGGSESATKTAGRLQKMFGWTNVAYAIELVKLNIISDFHKQGMISKKQMIAICIEVIKQHQVSWQKRRVQ
jgi:hypothetical protein